MLRTFDPMKVNVTFNNRQLRMFGDSLFTLARDEANVTLKKGAKGDSTYVLNANKAGKLTITLQQESPDVAFIENCSERRTLRSQMPTTVALSFLRRMLWWRSCPTVYGVKMHLM